MWADPASALLCSPRCGTEFYFNKRHCCDIKKISLFLHIRCLAKVSSDYSVSFHIAFDVPSWCFVRRKTQQIYIKVGRKRLTILMTLARWT